MTRDNSAWEFQKNIREFIRDNERERNYLLNITFKEPRCENVGQYLADYTINNKHGEIEVRNRRVLGIDIRGYSHLKPIEQLLASIVIYELLDKIISENRESPREFITTGDGFYLCYYAKDEKKQDRHDDMYLKEVINDFTSINKQIESIYSCINKETRNIKAPQVRGAYSFGPSYSIEIKNRSTKDRSEHLNAVNNVNEEKKENLDAIGEAVIRCARILSLDKGTHFMIDLKLIENETREKQIRDFLGKNKKLHMRLYKSPKNLEYPFLNLAGKYSFKHNDSYEDVSIGEKTPEKDWIPISNDPDFNKFL